MNRRRYLTPSSFVLAELINGRRVTQELILEKFNYWRLAAIIDSLQRRYKVRISRKDVPAKYAAYQRAYWLDDEAQQKIISERDEKGRATK